MADKFISFPPKSYSTSYKLRNEIKEYLLNKGNPALLKNEMLSFLSNSKSGKDICRQSYWSNKSGGGSETRGRKSPQCDKGSPLVRFLALNALELSLPATDVLLRDASGPNTPWFQLSGHPDTFCPAGPGTVWKRCSDGTEVDVYRALASEPALGVAPAFFREVLYKGQRFIELQDLLHGFRDPQVMDIKMGSRTFLEAEVTNTAARHDLYLKMVAVDPKAPTEEEHRAEAVTKLRYMKFREEQSSSKELGFRIEAMKFRGSPPVTDLKRVRGRQEVEETFELFLGGRSDVRERLVARLREVRQRLEASDYLRRHEVIGSSILVLYDDCRVGAWLIDFAKTQPLPEGVALDHRSPWVPGNHEEGFLLGLDNLILMLENAALPSSEGEKVKNPEKCGVALKL